jgi:lysyl-tRNA synthetase class I
LAQDKSRRLSRFDDADVAGRKFRRVARIVAMISQKKPYKKDSFFVSFSFAFVLMLVCLCCERKAAKEETR